MLALLLAGACGGSTPTAPAPAPAPAIVPRAIVLSSGSYTLALSLSQAGVPVCENNICTSISFCIGTPSSGTRTWAVDVERNGDEAIVRTAGSGNTLALTLRVAGGSVTGTISGAARDADGQMVHASGTIAGSAPFDGAIAVSGTINGQVAAGDGSCSNNGHVWSLSPR